MEDVFDVIWRGQKVGRFIVTDFDMWHWDGAWVADNISVAREFEALVVSFNFEGVLLDPRKGTRAILTHTKSANETHALLLSLKEGVLSLRILSDRESAKWLLENVT